MTNQKIKNLLVYLLEQIGSRASRIWRDEKDGETFYTLLQDPPIVFTQEEIDLIKELNEELDNDALMDIIRLIEKEEGR